MFSRRFIVRISGWVFLTLVMMAAVARGELLLQTGDRVVFYGDSITEQKLYTRYVQQYLLLRYPEMKLTFFNAGWGGDTAPGGANRLERDVLALNPTVVTLFFGMNDGRYRALEDSTIAAYRNGMEKIIRALTEKKIRVMVYSPGCVDYDRNPGRKDADYNKTLEALGEVGKELAAKYGCRFFDVIHPMMQVQEMEKAKDAKFTMIPDSIHPNAAGHEVMAHLMLQGLGAEPMPMIGQVNLSDGSAKGLKIVSRSQEKVELQTTEPMLLPYWFESSAGQVMKDCGFMDFAGAKLSVKGLAKGYYTVLDAGGQTVAQATDEQLAAGVSVEGANDADAKKLHDWIAQKEANYFTAWRQVRLANGLPDSKQQVYDGMMATDAGYAQLVRDLAQPRPAGLTISVMRAADGPNLAANKPYDASDPNKYSWGIGGLTDGSWSANSKNCFATGDSATFPKTVTVDLQQTANIGTVTIGVPEFGATKTVAMSISQDGKTFTEIGRHEFKQSAAQRYTFAFKPAAAKYVRLTYLDHYDQQVGYPVNFAFTTELEVYAAK